MENVKRRKNGEFFKGMTGGNDVSAPGNHNCCSFNRSKMDRGREGRKENIHFQVSFYSAFDFGYI